MARTRDQINAWKARLLERSTRNCLLALPSHHTDGYRVPQLPIIPLLNPPLPRIFEVLVRQHRRLRFAPLDDRDIGYHRPLVDLSDETRSATGLLMHVPVLAQTDDLVADLLPDDRQQILSHLHLHASTLLAEQGINALFVVLGLLEWVDPTVPEQVNRAPLLLLPVELHHTPGEQPYALRLLDDAIVLNPILRHRLAHAYELALPELPEHIAQLDLAALLGQITELVAGYAGWRVLPRALLGMFSFLDFMLYHDLEHLTERAVTHPLLTLLAGETTAPDPLVLPTLDHRPPQQCFQVLDADASQQAAIAAALAGESFVLLGAPGTGKSQTIVNMIAECLAGGKRVLFVSEKMTALQTVYERLRQCGLAEFCLELYGRRANQLLAALDMHADPTDPPAEVHFPYTELTAVRDQLNAYARALHTPFGAMGLTAHIVYAYLNALRDAPDCTVPMIDSITCTSEQLAAIDTLLIRLEQHRELLQTLAANPWYGCTVTTSSFSERGRIRNHVRSLMTALKELQPAAAAVADLLQLPAPTGLTATRALSALVTLLRAPHTASLWLSTDSTTIQYLQFDIADARQCYMAMAEIEAELESRYHVGTLAQAHRTLTALDVQGMLARFSGPYASWMRYLHPGYYRDMAALRGVAKPGTHLNYAIALADLCLAARLYALRQRLDANLPNLVAHSGRLFAGRRTDWDRYEAICAWTLDVLAQLRRLGCSPNLGTMEEQMGSGATTPTDSLCPMTYLCEIADMPLVERELLLAPAARFTAVLARCEHMLSDVAALFSPPATFADSFSELLSPAPDASVRVDANVVSNAPLPVRSRSPAVLLERLPELDAWWEFCELRRQAEPLGLASYLDHLGQNGSAAQQPRRAFYKRFYQDWLAAAATQLPHVRNFQRDQYTDLVERFRQLDAGQISAAQTRLRRMLLERRNQHERADGRHPVSSHPRPDGRQLLRDHAPLVANHKPCLLLNPCQVAQWLDPDALQFDLVIFDEASQICVEHALSAILRSQAMVIVGDTRQLAPAGFSAAGGMDAIHGSTAALTVADCPLSILEAGIAAGLPVRRLCWHYRSRHEALIAFANEQWYDGGLVTFPSAAASAYQGIVFEYVAEGEDACHGTGANLHEARRVVDLVCAHARANPERSLGVVTFGLAQQVAIMRELERRCIADATLAALFDTARTEPYFVKHVAHVQGDERDVIIISPGYRRDAQGRVRTTPTGMAFAPLNQPGGERYLNVAITRAREQIYLVTALRAEDINLGHTSHAGLRLFQAYLAYAQTRTPALIRASTGERRSAAGGQKPVVRHQPHAAPLEARPIVDDLAQALQQQGLSVERQVGQFAVRLALAIRDPLQPECYVLGIEGDGTDYRDALTARDRERLWSQMLMARGWRIERVWSAAWLAARETEFARLVECVSFRR